MVAKIERLFGEEDRQSIRRAVAEAEERTAGEIVPVVTPSCDGYAEAAWKGAALGALAGVAGAWALHTFGGRWGASLTFWALLPAVAGAGLGFLAASLPTLRRWLIDDRTLEARVQSAAETAFLEHEIFATRDRTGILVFLALFEHRVVVLGDSGISARVEQREWDEVVARLVEAIRVGRPAAGLVGAVEECGRILERHGVARRPDDRDELPGELRLEE